MTLIIVILTSVISIICFSNPRWFELLELNPHKVIYQKQYWRVFSHALVHANWLHLIINMLVLYSFGKGIEYYLGLMYHNNLIRFSPWIYYLLLYISAIAVSSFTTIQKYKNVYGYRAVGASGAVSAILFACIFFNPWQKLLFWAIIPIPGILFGVLYLWYSHYMSRHSSDNINHDAHFFGALYGITFPVLLHPALLYAFIQQVFSPTF